MTTEQKSTIVLGIRHHGPGSSHSVLQQLSEIKPDAIGLEWPKDSESTLKQFAKDGITPPIAQLQYLKSNPKSVAVLPLAIFSPEWQTIQYAHQHQIPLYPIDLPFSIQKQIQEENTAKQESRAWQLILKKTGFETIESFWDHYFERDTQTLDDFRQLSNLMAEIRLSATLSPLNEAREAFMRLEIKKIHKKHPTIAVVIGAYHSPAIQQLDEIPQKEDRKLLKGLRSKATISALIPFSYARLAKASGYAAGVDAPKLYETLFNHKDRAVEQWISQTARLLRQEGFHVSPAEAQAAVNMSRQLADMRQMNIPGQQELLQAARATLCHGQKAPFERIQTQALIGTATGSVPDHLITSPLIHEFHSQVKSLRLSPYWSPKKAVKKTPEKELDLRKPLHQKCSAFLHLLQLMDMSWGIKTSNKKRNRGSFRETWAFHWDIEHEIKLFQWGTRSQNLRALAKNLLRERWTSQYPLKKSIEDLELILRANLKGITRELIVHIQTQSASTDEILDILPANNALFQIAHYGDVRELDQKTIGKIALQLHEKICNLLPYQCQNIDDALSRDLFKALEKYNNTIKPTPLNHIQEPWLQTLKILIRDDNTHPRISAWSLRQLVDREQIQAREFRTHVRRHLSSTHEAQLTAAWLEGLLTGAATLLLFHEALFEAINSWIRDIPNDAFEAILPVLNRTFAHYKLSERSKIWQRLTQPQNSQSQSLADHYREFALQNLLQKE